MPLATLVPVVSGTIHVTCAWINGNVAYAVAYVYGYYSGIGAPIEVVTGGSSFSSTRFSYALTSDIIAHLDSLYFVCDIIGTLGAGTGPWPSELDVTDISIDVVFADSSTQTVYPTVAVPYPDTYYGGGLLGGSGGGIIPVCTTPPATVTIQRQWYGGLITAAYAVISGFTVDYPVIPDWLLIEEPGSGWTDQTGYLFRGDKTSHNFTLQLRQRGQASIPLWIPAGDTYAPTRGTPVRLYDHTPVGTGGTWFLVFSGLIQDIDIQWIGKAGNHICTITAVSLESVFDTVYASPYQYVNQTCGAIVTDLFNRLEAGCPVSLGVISDGPVVPLLVTNYEKVADLFTQLATTALYTWGVNPSTNALFFESPTSIAAPFTLADALVLAPGGDLSLSWKVNGADYRNRQAVRLSYDAFGHSMEFFIGTGQKTLMLSRPIQQVVAAYATLSTCNTATGTITGTPAAGDTVTIGPASGVWQNHHLYAPGGYIIKNGYLFKITYPTSGTAYSGTTEPTWIYITGDTVIDGSVIWTNEGPSGLATGTDAYTFVIGTISTFWSKSYAYSIGDEINVNGIVQQATTAGSSGTTIPATFNAGLGATTADGTGTLVWTSRGPCLDNTQFGHVLIQGSSATNLYQAINAYAPNRGITFSLPTWECNQCNAIGLSGSSFTLQQKAAGTGWVSVMSSTGTAFAWSTPFTTGGTSPQGSLGVNEGATITLQVYVVGTSTASPAVAYQPGSAVVTLATPLNIGSNLNIEYTRADGAVIEVENTPLVTQLAAITHGTGKVQQITDASQQGLISDTSAGGLQLAQQALAAYSQTPQSFEFKTYQPGFYPGMSLSVALDLVTSFTALLNGTGVWVVEEINAEFLRAREYFGSFGHYRYTIKTVDISQIGSYLDFWEGLSGGGSGSGGGAGAGSALVATSGGALTSSGGTTTAVNGYYTITVVGGNATIDLKNGLFQHLVLTSSTVTILTPIYTGSTIIPGTTFTLLVDQDGTGGRAIPLFTAGSFASDVGNWQIDGTLSTRSTYHFLYTAAWGLLGMPSTGEPI